MALTMQPIENKFSNRDLFQLAHLLDYGVKLYMAGICQGMCVVANDVLLIDEIELFNQRLNLLGAGLKWGDELLEAQKKEVSLTDHEIDLVKLYDTLSPLEKAKLKINPRLSIIFAKIKQVEEKIKRREPLTAEEEKWSEMKPFIEGIIGSQTPPMVRELFELPYEPDYWDEETSRILGNETLAKRGGSVKVYEGCFLPTLDELQIYFDKLKVQLEGMESTMAFIVNSNNHGVNFAYDKKLQQWRVINSNNLQLQLIDHAHIAQSILDAALDDAIHIRGYQVKDHMQPLSIEPPHPVNAEVAKRLSKSNVSLAFLATYHGDLELLQKIKQTGEISGFNSDVQCDDNNTYDETIQKRFPYDLRYFGEPALHMAAIRGRPEVFRFLLESGAERDAWSAYGNVAHVAIRLGINPLAIIEILINTQSFDFNKPDNDDKPPVWLAVEKNNYAVLDALVKKGGADINCKVNNKNLYHLAFENENWGMWVHLIELGLDPTQPLTSDGRNIAHLAVAEYKHEVLQALLDNGYGALFDTPDGSGQTPRQLAINRSFVMNRWFQEHPVDSSSPDPSTAPGL